MAKYAIGKKLGMMQVFDPGAKTAKAVTVVAVEPSRVVGARTKAAHGYAAIQIGYGTRKRMHKAQEKFAGDVGSFAGFREVRIGEQDTLPERGVALGLEQFSSGDMVSVSGVSKGRGFAGVVKRHGFAGGPRTHGQKHAEREPGSIGGGGRAGGKTAKGKRMAGHMGSVRVTVKHLVVADVDQDKNVLMLYGAVPGHIGSWIEIKA